MTVELNKTKQEDVSFGCNQIEFPLLAGFEVLEIVKKEPIQILF
jgi:hypothetical protein